MSQHGRGRKRFSLERGTTLLVIDMQPEFPTCRRALSGVLEEVRLAKRQGAAIVVLEYDTYGLTHEAIREELKGYRRKAYTTKYDDDGSEEFITICRKKGFPTRRVRAIGVNRGYCVYDTVEGIKKELDCFVETVRNATACWPGQAERNCEAARVSGG